MIPCITRLLAALFSAIMAYRQLVHKYLYNKIHDQAENKSMVRDYYKNNRSRLVLKAEHWRQTLQKQSISASVELLSLLFFFLIMIVFLNRVLDIIK